MACWFGGKRRGHRFRNVRRLIALFGERQQIERGGSSNEKATDRPTGSIGLVIPVKDHIQSTGKMKEQI